MKKEIYFKGKITKVSVNLKVNHTKDIIYRVVNFNNMFFFAEEVSTGCIFPIYCFSSTDQDTNIGFRHYSYLRNGEYFVFSPIGKSENIFEYSLDESFLKSNGVESVNKRELRKYLRSKKKDDSWKKELELMESKNNYMCDLSLIKEKIEKLSKEQNALDLDFNMEPTYESYTPNIDLNEISEFGYDLSDVEDLSKLIGREGEKKQIIKTVCINRDSILLVGPPDSGKTAIIQSLARDIRENNNSWLKDKIIFKLNENAFEGTNQTISSKKINKFINFCIKYQDELIILIDDCNIRTDTFNILKPYILSGDITVVGTMTSSDYIEYSKKDYGFMKKMEKLDITVPSIEMRINIVIEYIKLLEKNYGIKLDMGIENKILIAEFITKLSDEENHKIDHIDITSAKKIIRDAFTDAVYYRSASVTLDNIYFGILNYSKMSLTLKKQKLIELKEKLKLMEKYEESKLEPLDNEYVRVRSK